MGHPTHFTEANDVLRCPPELKDCNDLYIHRTTQVVGKTPEGNDLVSPLLISCWRLSKEELEEVTRTGLVYFMVWYNTHPPINISGINPII